MHPRAQFWPECSAMNCRTAPRHRPSTTHAIKTILGLDTTSWHAQRPGCGGRLKAVGVQRTAHPYRTPFALLDPAWPASSAPCHPLHPNEEAHPSLGGSPNEQPPLTGINVQDCDSPVWTLAKLHSRCLPQIARPAPHGSRQSTAGRACLFSLSVTLCYGFPSLWTLQQSTRCSTRLCTSPCN